MSNLEDTENQGGGGFSLSTRLAADTLPVRELGFSSLRLANDSRFPWLILVPRLADVQEFHELSPAERTFLMEEIAAVSQALSDATGAAKINVGALGNIEPQMHVHVVARFKTDKAWPGPIWGHGTPIAYSDNGEAFLSIFRPLLAEALMV